MVGFLGCQRFNFAGNFARLVRRRLKEFQHPDSADFARAQHFYFAYFRLYRGVDCKEKSNPDGACTRRSVAGVWNFHSSSILECYSALVSPDFSWAARSDDLAGRKTANGLNWL